jgi:hypothetical protein
MNKKERLKRSKDHPKTLLDEDERLEQLNRSINDESLSSSRSSSAESVISNNAGSRY